MRICCQHRPMRCPRRRPFLLALADMESGSLDSSDDHGNSATTATAVPTPSLTGGVSEVVTDVDWFRFNATAGTQYGFNVLPGTLDDARMTLYDANGVDWISSTVSTSIQWLAPKTAAYFVEVAPFGSDTGSYALQINVGGVTPSTTLIVDVVQTSIPENGSSQATVTRSTDGGNLLVNLLSSDTTEAVVPSTVTIFSGSKSATFTVTGQNDLVADGADRDHSGLGHRVYRRQRHGAGNGHSGRGGRDGW